MNRLQCVRPSHRWGRRHSLRGVVVLAMVLAVLLAGALALVMQGVQRQRDENERVRVTVERMERIQTALCAYYRLNGSLPSAVTPPAPVPTRSNVPRVLGWYGNAGALDALGLSVEDVTDGWGRLFTVFQSNGCPGSLPIDTNGDGIPEILNACVVLISHGPSGRGGFLSQATTGAQLTWTGPLPSGAGSPANGAGGEWRNTRSNGSGAPQSPPLAAAAPTAACTVFPGDRQNPDHPCHFDDLVRYFTSDTGGNEPLCR